jgi:hypothetical protein
MKIGKKGQAAWFDMVLVIVSFAFFVFIVWGLSGSGLAEKSQGMRTRQDFTHSLLVSSLHSTLDSPQARYRGKSLSDVIGMYFTSDDVEITFLEHAVREVNLTTYMGEKVVDWSLQGKPDDPNARKFCISGTRDNLDGSVEGECTERTVTAKATSSSVEISLRDGMEWKTATVILQINWE